MNSHYHPYSDNSAHHPPSPDSSNGFPQMAPGSNGGMGGHHHPQMNHPYNDRSRPGSVGGGAVTNNTNNNGPITMDGQQNFQNISNNMERTKHCSGCGDKIVDRFFLHALDRFWHNACLKCSCCNATLGDLGSSCYTRSGMILCKTDYSRMFGMAGSCNGCGQTIQPNEMVMRTTSGGTENSRSVNGINDQIQHQVFHPTCFACSKCSTQLNPGDRLYVADGSLVCEQDWEKLSKTSGPGATSIRKGKVGRPRRSRE